MKKMTKKEFEAQVEEFGKLITREANDRKLEAHVFVIVLLHVLQDVLRKHNSDVLKEAVKTTMEGILAKPTEDCDKMH